jgi:regulator of nucleoside diphosphate kinase
MDKKTIYITESDYEKLETLLENTKKTGSRNQDNLSKLEEELERCEVVESQEIPSGVVTLNSKVRFRDLDTDKEMIITLVFPSRANLSEGRISVTSPIGTAILGYAENDVIEWKVQAGTKNIRIEEVIYQPEAAGDYHLSLLHKSFFVGISTWPRQGWPLFFQ